ncbi:hypothetical protein NQZ68_016248 [Dissostichus eleginoides]|nr:hypothetical protein NQZ68_016248 [Dissostichus eleginoides]
MDKQVLSHHFSTAMVKKKPPYVSSHEKLAPSASDVVQRQMAVLFTTEQAFSQLLYELAWAAI